MVLATQFTLALAAFLCSLVAGFLFAFAVVVMPGLGHLDDREFLRAFQVVDRVIQRGQPLFGVAWIGSVIALVAGVVLGVGHLAGVERLLLLSAASIYLLGVQLPTLAINIPLNNELQRLDVPGTDAATWRAARGRFETRWNRWNLVRTVLASVASALLLALLVRS